MLNTQVQITQRRQMNNVKIQIDSSIKFFIKQIQSIYCKHESKTKSQLAYQNHINGLSSKELYKILTIMIQPNPHISMDSLYHQKQKKNFNYQEDYMQAQSQSNDFQIKEENHNQEEKQIDYDCQSSGDQSQLKKGEKKKNRKKNKGQGQDKTEKKIQYYTTTQQQQKLIIDACKEYYEEKQSLSRSQISIIARQIVGKNIFKASYKWVRRLLFRIPLLNRYVLGLEPVSKKKQVPLNQKPIVKSEIIEKEDNSQEYFWNQQEILQNIKKAFRQRSNK